MSELQNAATYILILKLLELYSVFHRFRQAKFAKGFKLKPVFNTAPALKMKLASKVVNVDSKIIISIP